MDTELHPSAVSNEDDYVMISEYRTSMTCNFSPHLTKLGADLTIKIGNYLDLDPFLGESIQGQKYEEGEFYKATGITTTLYLQNIKLTVNGWVKGHGHS